MLNSAKGKPDDVVQEVIKMYRQRQSIYSKRNTMLGEMEDMALNKWELPKKARRQNDWVHTVISSDPQNALKASAQILGTVKPKIRYTPLLPGKYNEDNATAIEKNLAWQFDLMERRHKSGLLDNILTSALQYGTITGQILYLPHQIEAMDALGGDTTRIEDALTRGKFAFILRNPKTVYPVYTDYGLDNILMVSTWSAAKFLAFYGKMISKSLKDTLDDDKTDNVIVYQYDDLSRSVVLASPQKGNTAPTTVPNKSTGEGSMEIVVDEENSLGFLPWVVRETGNSLFENPEDSLRPLLFGIHTSKHWHTSNIMLSIGASEILVRAASPRRRVTGPNPSKGYKINWNEPGGIEEVDTAHIAEDVRANDIDQGVWMVIDRLGTMMGTETVAEIIQNPAVSPDVPYSALNLVFQLGANSLKPYQRLAEEWLSDAFRVQLRYVDKFVEEDDPLISFENTLGGAGSREAEVYTLYKGMFDVKNLYLDVGLTAAVPTDQVAKANAVSMMHQNLRYPLARGLEDMGVTDPQDAMDEWSLEQLKMNKVTLAMQAEQADLELKIQEMQQALGQIAQSQQQLSAIAGQLQQAQAEQPEGEPPQEGANPGGEGFDGGRGGTPATQANPEGQTGGDEQLGERTV